MGPGCRPGCGCGRFPFHLAGVQLPVLRVPRVMLAGPRLSGGRVPFVHAILLVCPAVPCSWQGGGLADVAGKSRRKNKKMKEAKGEGFRQAWFSNPCRWPSFLPSEPVSCWLLAQVTWAVCLRQVHCAGPALRPCFPSCGGPSPSLALTIHTGSLSGQPDFGLCPPLPGHGPAVGCPWALFGLCFSLLPPCSGLDCG